MTGYERIRNENHTHSEEDAITQRIVEEIRLAQRDRSLPRWADRYFIRDQVLVAGKNLIGMKRPRIDIEIESAESQYRPLFHFEAKRLRNADSVRDYLNHKGLGRFLGEKYARSTREGGMVGYVQSDLPDQWAQKIERKLQRNQKNEFCLTADGDWTAIRLISELKHTYRTQHDRPTFDPITVYHTLLEFQERRENASRGAGGA